MSRFRIIAGLVLLAVFMAGNGVYGQMMGHGGMRRGEVGMGMHGGMNWPGSQEIVTVSGTVIVDSSHFHAHYYLDEDGDAAPDHHLSFGPWWYEPETGATRPQDGDAITVKGGVYGTSDIPETILVFEINGLEWRAPEELLPWSGGWMHAGVGDTIFIHPATDTLSWMAFPAEGMRNMMERMESLRGGIAADSVYVHFEPRHPQELPVPTDPAMMMGYHMGFTDPYGNELMHDQMMMDFDHEIEMHFHYDEDKIRSTGISEHNLVLQFFTRDGRWGRVPGAAIDTLQNSVVVNSTRVYSYYGLSAPSSPPTIVDGEIEEPVPVGFALLQNHPNPFNPSTTLGYHLSEEGYVKLEIYDALGQYVATLMGETKAPGYHTTRWDGRDDAGRDVSSGMYVYRLQVGDLMAAKKMSLIR